MARKASLLSDLIDLLAALRADTATDPAARRQRDRRIGTELGLAKGRSVAQIRGWLRRVELPGRARPGEGAAQLGTVIGLGLTLLGLLTGWGAARAVLHYTGQAPINVVNVLVVLILPQLLLLLFWLLAMVPRRIPLIADLQSALRFLNPGRLARLLARPLAAGSGARLAQLWDPENALALGPAARWLFSLWSQLFAFAFNVGALLALLYLVSFSDLAFGWSTTLALDSEAFHRLVRVLAAPWQHFAAEAVPSAALVDASRFFRLEGGVIGSSNVAPPAQVLGGWWPFLLASLLCYGLLPRALTLLVSWQRFRHHVRSALVALPGAPELLARMNSPLVRTAATRAEAATPTAPDGAHGARAAPARQVSCAVVVWAGSDDDEPDLMAVLPAVGILPTAVLHAGGSRSTAEDVATVAALCGSRDQGAAVVVKAWEPPLLEFVDFVQSVRARCDRQQPIVVLLRGDGAPVSAADLELWDLTLRPLKDPNLYIEPLP